MKKLIFILLCFCLTTFGSSARIIEVTPAGAWGVLGISGGGETVVAGCDSVAQASPDASVTALYVGKYAVSPSEGNQFVASKAMTVCKVIVKMSEEGTVTGGTLVAAIYLDDGADDITGSAIGGNSNSIDATDLTGSAAEITFDGLSATLTNGLTY